MTTILTTLTHTGVVLPILGCLVFSVCVSLYRRAGVFFFLTLLSVVGIFGLTLFRGLGPPSFSPDLRWAHDGLGRFVGQLGQDREITLNILLFVPAAVLLTLRYRRPWLTISGLTLSSLAIEVVQGLIGAGNPDISDILANTTGAVFGVAAASIGLIVAKRGSPSLIAAASTAAALLLLAAASVLPLAQARESAVEQTLRERFAGTTYADYRQWDEHDELATRVFRVGSLNSDGSQVNGGNATVRFPTNTLGLTRCVLATWTPTEFAVRGYADSHCTDFLG